MTTWNYQIEVVKGDFGYSIPLKAQDKSGTVVDLTGATTVQLKVALPDASTCLFIGNCVVDDADGGLCHYVVASGNFPTVATYNAELEIKWATTKTVTCRGLTIKVLKELPAT